LYRGHSSHIPGPHIPLSTYNIPGHDIHISDGIWPVWITILYPNTNIPELATHLMNMDAFANVSKVYVEEW